MTFVARLSTWLQEPLWRFLLLGFALLAVDRMLVRDPAADAASTRIRVTTSQQAALAQAFRAEHGRAPSGDELQTRLDRWIDEQVLYREALALGLDRRDAIVQRQLTQKMRFLIEDASLLPEPAQADLQAWLDQHPERYGQGPVMNFDQVFLSRGRHGGQLQSAARQVAAQLVREPQAFVGLGDPFLVGQSVTEADDARIRRDFGPEFGQALAELPQGEWAGPVTSAFGLHMVRVTGRAPFRPARLEDVAERVRLDYQLAQREARNRAALAELRSRYRIEIEDARG